MELIVVSGFASIFSKFERQVPTETALSTDGCGDCGEKEVWVHWQTAEKGTITYGKTYCIWLVGAQK